MKSVLERRVREFRVKIAESARAQSREEGAPCTMRAQCESTESECRGESKGSRVQRVRECRVESTQSRDEGAECTVRAQFERAEAECRGESTESRVQGVRECRDESAEIVRMHSQSADSRVQRVRVQRVRECRDESAI
jgi:hypothetical protein